MAENNAKRAPTGPSAGSSSEDDTIIDLRDPVVVPADIELIEVEDEPGTALPVRPWASRQPAPQPSASTCR